MRRLSIFFSTVFLAVSAFSQPPKVMDAVELQLALKKLNTLGSVLYVAAHPDDENTAFLTYLSNGLGIRAAYLSITRGEGGQNLIGTEQGDLLGVIRTQELLAARRIDGAEQYFTRAIDFGFSKSSEEALRMWNKDSVLADVVWIIRNFQPDVIVTRFSPTIGGHGQHTASAILANEAFGAAADSTKFPEQLRTVKPWQAKRILYNTSRFNPIPFDTAKAVKLDVGVYSPLLGRSFTEISGESRSMHKSQGFGASQNRGPNVNYFLHTDGDSARSSLFEGIDVTWARIGDGETIGKILDSASQSFDPANPSTSVPILMRAYAALHQLPRNIWVEVKLKELIEVIRGCTGLWVDAITDDFSYVPGADVPVMATVLNRSTLPIKLTSVSFGGRGSSMNVPLVENAPCTVRLKFTLPIEHPFTQPYWLGMKTSPALSHVADRMLLLHPDNPPPVNISFSFDLNGSLFALQAPVQYRSVDPVEGEMYRPMEVVPLVAINIDEGPVLFPSLVGKQVSAVLKSNKANIHGTVRPVVPEGWKVSPEDIQFSFERKGEEQTVRFTITPTQDGASGRFSIEADIGADHVTHGMTTIRYPHIPPQTTFPLANGKLLRLNVKRKKSSVGYIMGAGDMIPQSLRQLGYTLTMLSDQDLADTDLSRFESIIAGVRAYNTRPQLKVHQRRLMEYVNRGGTYIVQYATSDKPESEDMGPFPMNISRDRVAVEDAPVDFLLPSHPVLNTPNKVTQNDFIGWIQERGLYFADTWDSTQYQAILSCNDPNEPPRRGGLLVAKYGKGNFVYTGYSFFRQLPAGILGAYRLFVNLIELGSSRTAKR